MKEKTLDNEKEQTKFNKRKELIKWFWIGLLLIIWYWLLRWFFMVFVVNKFTPKYEPHINLITLIFSFLLPLFVEILIVYFLVLRGRRKVRWNSKLKKGLEISLITFLVFLLLSAFAFFTKVGVVPNWFDIKLLGSSPNRNMILHEYMPIGCTWGGYCKPIIYLYPTVQTQVNVTLWAPENLSHTYPKYNSEKWWNVIAQPNWDLEDVDTWRKLYALYREWKSESEDNFDEWFVVKWENIIPFLEEKLAILWLNECEAEEFIVYRLPQMENNEWNLIRFKTKAEQDKNMQLKITPKPDTVIRVMMDWKAVEEPIDIPEQKLFTPERNGFTVVEWWWSHRN